MLRKIILSSAFIALASLVTTAQAGSEQRMIIESSSYSSSDGYKVTREISTASLDSISIDSAGNFVIAKSDDGLRHPTENMGVVMLPSTVEYMVRYGIPEYASDTRLQGGTLLGIVSVSYTKTKDGKTSSEQFFLLEIRDMTGKINQWNTKFWKAKTE